MPVNLLYTNKKYAIPGSNLGPAD